MKTEFSLGRSPENDIVIDNPVVGRSHFDRAHGVTTKDFHGFFKQRIGFRGIARPHEFVTDSATQFRNGMFPFVFHTQLTQFLDLLPSEIRSQMTVVDARLDQTVS